MKLVIDDLYTILVENPPCGGAVKLSIQVKGTSTPLCLMISPDEAAAVGAALTRCAAQDMVK
jgi:hypothetical protein